MGGCGAHLPTQTHQKSTWGRMLTEHHLETGRRSPIQPKLKERPSRNWVGEKKLKRIRMGLVPVEEPLREIRSTWADPRPGKYTCLLGNLLGWFKGGWRSLCFILKGMHMQERERLVPQHTSQPKGVNTPAPLLHTTTWHKIGAEDQSSCAETDHLGYDPGQPGDHVQHTHGDD